MKFLKKVLFFIIGVVALILLIALFVNKEVRVERSIVLNQSTSRAYDYFSHLNNQREYGVWQKKDPATIFTSSGVDGNVGYISSWSSEDENVGVGEQEITSLDPNKRIETDLRFKKPQEMSSTAYFDIKPHNEGSEVTWGFYFEIGYPFNFFNLFMNMDEQLGPDLQKGLENAKKELDKSE